MSNGKKIHALYETDILFSVYNDLLVNMIYLLPGSCVVTVNHNLMSSPHLNFLAEQSQLLYIEISNFSVPIPPACNDKTSNVRFHKYSDRCREELQKQDVYVQPGMLMSYLRIAKTYSMIHKYYDESEGEYKVFCVCSTNNQSINQSLFLTLHMSSLVVVHIMEVGMLQRLTAANTTFGIISQHSLFMKKILSFHTLNKSIA